MTTIKADLHYARQAVASIVDRISRGDESADGQLRPWLKKFPQILDDVGDLSARTVEAWIRVITDGNRLEAIALRREIRNLRLELGGRSPGIHERLWISDIIHSNLALAATHRQLAHLDPDDRAAATLARRSEVFHRRFRTAMRELQRVQGHDPETAGTRAKSRAVAAKAGRVATRLRKKPTSE